MKYNFNCPNRHTVDSCPFCDRKGLLYYSTENPEEEVECGQTHTILVTSSVETLPKDITKGSITSERERRATKDFRNNVLPSMKPNDRKSWLKSRGEKT